MTQIRPFMFLGGSSNAKNLKWLQENEITHVLNVADDVPDFFPTMFSYCRLDVKDWGEDIGISRVFPKAFDFISSLNQNNKVLIHCAHGMNRSVCVCISILMKLEQKPLKEIFEEVSSKRSVYLDHENFEELQVYEQLLFQTNSMLGVDVLEVSDDLKLMRSKS